MQKLNETVKNITNPDIKVMAVTQKKLNNLTKPLGSRKTRRIS